jgi:hypothetical protein
VETSNTLLLVPPGGQGGMEAVGSASFTFVTEVIPPQLGKLKAMLGRCPYGTCAADKEAAQRGRPTLADLCGTVQASEREIGAALAAAHAVEVGGRWCAVAGALQEDTMDAVLDAVLEHDLSLGHLSVATLLGHLGEHAAVPDPTVVLHCLALYGAPAATAGECALDSDKVAVFRAHQLFRKAPRMAYADLMASWELSLPSIEGGFDPAKHAALLGGLALRVEPLEGVACGAGAPLAEGDEVEYFPERDLPAEPSLRFAALFAKHSLWTREALAPYISPLVPDAKAASAMLLKHTRAVIATAASDDAAPVFCAR